MKLFSEKKKPHTHEIFNLTSHLFEYKTKRIFTATNDLCLWFIVYIQLKSKAACTFRYSSVNDYLFISFSVSRSYFTQCLAQCTHFFFQKLWKTDKYFIRFSNKCFKRDWKCIKIIWKETLSRGLRAFFLWHYMDITRGIWIYDIWQIVK